MKTLIVALLFFTSTNTYADDKNTSLPSDVLAFIEQRDLCDHFRGEDAYNEERRAFLGKKILEFCADTNIALAKLKSKYIYNKKVTSTLNQYEDNI